MIAANLLTIRVVGLVCALSLTEAGVRSPTAGLMTRLTRIDACTHNAKLRMQLQAVVKKIMQCTRPTALQRADSQAILQDMQCSPTESRKDSKVRHSLWPAEGTAMTHSDAPALKVLPLCETPVSATCLTWGAWLQVFSCERVLGPSGQAMF